jgi:ribosomal protein S16
MRWAGLVARMGEKKKKAYRILVESQKERDH